MQCVICKHGTTQPGQATVMLERGECIIIFKNVPGVSCSNCGEYYLSESVTEEVLKRAENAIIRGAEVEIVRYAA